MPILGAQSSGAKGSATAPTIGTATAGDANASVTFTAPSFSKLPITSYTVTASPGGATGTGSSSPITVSGLSNGTSYTFTVAATHSNGNSPASSSSNSVTPVAPKFGYMMSGYGWDTDAKVSSTDKLNYSTDVKSSTSIDVGALAPSQAFANSGVAGYRAGGSGNGGQQSTIQKIAFINDAVSSVAATLSGTKTMGGAFANSGTAGYIAGGVSSGTTTTDKLTFSNDTRATIASRLPYALYTQAGFANSGTAGYVAGGNQSGATQHSAIHKLVFSNDTWTNNVSYLSAIADSFGAAGMANSGTAGYIAGGNYMTPQVPFDYAQALNIIAKVTFSNDSRSNLGATLAAVSTWLGSHANSGTAGYVCGGSSSFRSNIQKLVFSNDTISTLAATLSEPKYQMAAMANSGVL
jgi:hypothetical protein